MKRLLNPSFDYFTLPASSGKNTAGMSLTWFAPVSSFTPSTGIKDPPETGTDPGDTVIISTTHTFQTGFGFIPLPVDAEVSEMKLKSGGDSGSTTETTEMIAFLPGDSPELLELVHNICDEQLIAVQKTAECANAQFKQAGCSCYPAKATYEFTSGTKKTGGRKGYVITFTAICTPSFYAGTITEKPTV